MKIAAVIPARLQSSRFPGKILAEINGRPMLWHVWKRTCEAEKLDEVFIAADSREVFSIVKAWGGKPILTAEDCTSGTERIASIVDQLEADWIINVQGDEPFISFKMIDQLIDQCQEGVSDLVTAVYPINKYEDLQNPNIVKVVRMNNGQALYFSRSPIPFARDVLPEAWLSSAAFWGHVGIYAYRRDILLQYHKLQPGNLENIEKLEQLRFLEAGLSIQTIVTPYRSIAVDTVEDLEKVRRLADQGDQHD